MDKSHTYHPPPWERPECWNQIEPFLRMSCRNIAHPEELKHLALQIKAGIDEVNSQLQTLCLHTCQQCLDKCCSRATIWYDFRDLLYLYFSTDTLPRQQIGRDEYSRCSKLGVDGCTMHRSVRPFVCTWYICPAQMEIVRRKNGEFRGSALLMAVTEIQEKRKQMEKLFYSAVLPN